MAKHKRPRTTPPFRPKRADLAQPLIDPTTDPAEYLAGIYVEPLFEALRIGALDSHLEKIATLANERLAAIDAFEELIVGRLSKRSSSETEPTDRREPRWRGALDRPRG